MFLPCEVRHSCPRLPYRVVWHSPLALSCCGVQYSCPRPTAGSDIHLYPFRRGENFAGTQTLSRKNFYKKPTCLLRAA